MRAMLIWSDGLKINTRIFESEGSRDGRERAVEQMHREYDECNCYNDACSDFGAYKANDSCCYAAEDKDTCAWLIVELQEALAPVIPNIMPQDKRSELFGSLVDVVEDYLDDSGITLEMIPNNERDEEDDNAAIIYGDDYDYLADRFSEILGVARYADRNDSVDEIVNALPDDVLEAAYRKKEMMRRMDDAMIHAAYMGYEITDAEAEKIAKLFLDNLDCNVAENDQFERLIKDIKN